MGWRGWFSAGGIEIINNPRTAAYARHASLRWDRFTDTNPDLAPMLGDGSEYRTPLLDDAEWTDPDIPASYEFFGFYCLGVTGLEDSSRGAEVIEYTTEGGSVGRVRHSTKTVVFNGALVAASDAGAQYGMQWLRQATLGGPCQDSPFGGDLCYLASPPHLAADGDANPQDCLDPYRRTLRKFKLPIGPTITQEYAVKRGALWGVQFAGVAGVPWQFGRDVDVVAGFLGADPTGIATNIDVDGSVINEPSCAEVEWTPMVDPLCPALVPPPGPTNVPLGCVTLPTNWRRRQFTVPADVVPLWSDMVPIISVHAPATTDLRNLRLRFYSDPFDESDPAVDPCAFCGDMLFSYVPQGTVITLDATREQVLVTMPGDIQRRADNLVYGPGGKPFEWPALSCGFAYVVTVDLPQTQVLPTLDLTLTPRAR